MKKILIIYILLGFPLFLNAENNMPELNTVEYVDVNRYMGVWYEIARFTQRFEKGLVGVTATYQLRGDGKVDVLNAGLQDTLEGKVKTAHGTAIVVDKKTNSKLKVSFFWPFYGKYWIIELGKDYEYAVVGEPKRKYLWILSRAPRMPTEVYAGIIERLKEKGFDVAKLDLVEQKAAK